MNTDNSAQILDGIFPIEAPLPPDYMISGTELFLVAFVLLVIGLLAWRIYLSPRYTAIRQIKNLQRSRQNNLPDERQQVSVLAEAIRRGLNINHLDINHVFPVEAAEIQPLWQEFIQQLSIARFSPAKIEKINVDKLRHQAIHLLKKWP